MSQYEFKMAIDFGSVGYEGSRESFKVSLDASPLSRLILDAKSAHRVYELLLISRPGDVWDYVMVIPENLPRRVTDRVAHARKDALPMFSEEHPWPEGCIPFKVFDNLFYWSWDDTDPADEAWLSQRDSSVMHGFAQQLLSSVNSAKANLNWNDTLLIHILHLIKKSKHAFDLLSREAAIAEGQKNTPPAEVHTEEFYATLSTLIRDTALCSIAYRADGDYRILKLLATEQRRRVNHTKHTCSNSLYLSALINNTINNQAWDSEIHFHSEGLAYGDLFIQGPGLEGNSIKTLIEIKHRIQPARYILSFKDEGDIAGYEKKSGEGWWLYTMQPESTRRACMLNIYQDRLYENIPMLTFNDAGETLYAHEKTVIILDSKANTDAALAIAKVLADWPRSESIPLLIDLDANPVTLLESDIPVFHPPTNAIDEAELQFWLKGIFKERQPWFDAFILIDCPSWVTHEVQNIVDHKNDPWTPWVISTQEQLGGNNLLLTKPVSNQISNAHQKAQAKRRKFL